MEPRMNPRIAIRDLLDGGECSAMCICGMEESQGDCTCRCGGIYHGAAAWLEIERVTTGPWWKTVSRPGTWIWSALPDIKMVAPVGYGGPDVPRVIKYGNRSFDCYIPNTSMEDTKHLEMWQLDWVARALVRFGHAASVSTGRYQTIVTGVRLAEEARVIAAIFDYAYYGHGLVDVFHTLTDWEWRESETPDLPETVRLRDMTDEWLAKQTRQEQNHWRTCAARAGMTLPAEVHE